MQLGVCKYRMYLQYHLTGQQLLLGQQFYRVQHRSLILLRLSFLRPGQLPLLLVRSILCTGIPIDGHSAPQSEIVDGPMHTSPCGTRHISSSGLPSSNCLMILSIAIPSGGFSLGQTSHRLVVGNDTGSPVNKATSASARTSDLVGQPGMERSTSIASDKWPYSTFKVWYIFIWNYTFFVVGTC